MRHPWVFERAGLFAQALLTPQDGDTWIRSGPGPLKAWTATRDFPPLAPRSFRRLWRARKAKQREAPTE